MRRPLQALVAAALLVAFAPQTEAASTPDLTWTDCPPAVDFPLPADPRMRCATLKVPLDYRNPHGPTIDIAISKIATAKPGLRRGVLFHNGGGPGAASLHLPSAYAQIYPPEVLDRYDLIGFDPRGVGYSTPVTCDRTAEQYPADRYFPFPAPDGSITENVKFAREVARDCREHGGVILPHITTANTARDMDRIRISLGERKISYNSGSYGSYLGAIYATMFADRTDRFVIDSNVDPNRVWHEEWTLWDPSLEVRFNHDIAPWLADRDATYHLGATPAEVRQRYFDLVARLDANPVTVPGLGPVNGNTMRVIVFGTSYHTAFFPDLAEIWVFLEEGGVTSRRAPVLPQVPADNLRASQLAVLCGDARAPRDTRHYQREVTTNRALYPLMGGMGTNIWPCAFWHDPVEPPVKVTNRGPANILMVQTMRDPVAPYAGALGMRKALGQRARMVTVDTGNHGAYDPSTPSCAVREAHRFLETGVLPARDQFCAPDPAPEATITAIPMLG